MQASRAAGDAVYRSGDLECIQEYQAANARLESHESSDIQKEEVTIRLSVCSALLLMAERAGVEDSAEAVEEFCSEAIDEIDEVLHIDPGNTSARRLRAQAQSGENLASSCVAQIRRAAGRHIGSCVAELGSTTDFLPGQCSCTYQEHFGPLPGP